MNMQKLIELIDKVAWYGKAVALDPTFANDRSLLWAKIELRTYVLDEFGKSISDQKEQENHELPSA